MSETTKPEGEKMSAITTHHERLNENGIGKCSVPMWMQGAPCGFCDKPAYGVPPKSARIFNYCINEYQRADNRYNGHVPALACPGHGGPRSRVFADGNAFCAVFPDFQNLQESPSGWGSTPDEARIALMQETGQETR